MDGNTPGRGSRVGALIGNPPRRVVVTGVGAAVLAILSDRGLRLDLPQPTPPAPARRRIPDEALLVTEVRELDILLAGYPASAGDSARALALGQVRTLLEAQHRVVVGRLTNQGVPSSEIHVRAAPGATPSTSPSGAAKGGPGPGVRLTEAQLAGRLGTVATGRWQRLASARAGTRETLSAAYVTRLACAAILGRPVALRSAGSPGRTALAARTQPLGYAFEIVAAHSTGAQRKRALGILEEIRQLDRELGSASDPGGWSLPFPVTDPASASRLATEVLGAAAAANVEVAGASPTAASLEDVVRWSARIQLIARRWGRELTAFPGTRG